MTDDRSPIAADMAAARVPDQVPPESSENDGAANPAWWLRPAALLANELSGTVDGLSSSEARSRLKRYGPNQVRDQRHTPLVWQFLRRFRNPLVLILVAASIVSALTGDIPSFGIIASMILLSVTLDFVQEHRAGQAAMRLSQSVALLATVVRDGTQKRIRATQVVPGDIVILAAGALVPADGVLLEARDLHVNQALLTGEPFPVQKDTAVHADATDTVDATNALFMGTSVVSGTARLLVYRTGVATAMGDISRSLSAQSPPTAFDLGIRRFGMLIMRLTVLMVLFVLMVNAVEHKPLLDSFLFAVALAVGLTPELLPMVVSVTLARGALRMADKHVIVKRLAAIENLGSMDVLCTDKTGTLTEAKIRLERHVDVLGRNSDRVLSLPISTVASRPVSRVRSMMRFSPPKASTQSAWKKIDEVPVRLRAAPGVSAGRRRRIAHAGRQGRAGGHSPAIDTIRSGATPEGIAWDDVTRQSAQTQLETLKREGLARAWRGGRTMDRDSIIASTRGDESEIGVRRICRVSRSAQGECRAARRGSRRRAASRSRS